MINRLLIVGMVFVFFGCAPAGKKNSIKTGNIAENKMDSKQDTAVVVIFPFGEKEEYLFKDAKAGAELTSADLDKIDSLLNKCIADYNTQQEKDPALQFKKDKSEYLIDLKKYKRQYVAVTNDKGEKEVWINCFCFDDPYWKTYIIEVNDGGNCFFNLKINLSADTCYNLLVNGDA
jgi:hypothetical protein